jgi:hypothetical protein
VEIDGRHVGAIDAHGKLLWVRNPVNESSRSYSSTDPMPVIVGFRRQGPFTADAIKYFRRFGLKAEDPIVEITFSSSVYGHLDEETGDFVNSGAN